MRRYRLVLQTVSMISVLLVFLSGCATTSLTTAWHDEQYSGKDALDDVLIIAVTQEESVRRIFEDTFVAEFAGSDVQAIPSYTLASSDIKPTKSALDDAIAESGAQFVLITRHLGTDQKEHYRPPEPVMIDPFYSSYYRYHPFAYRQVHYTPGYTYTVTTVSLEANLYDAQTEKIVWSVQSKSVDPKMNKDYIVELVDIFSKNLQEKGLL